jgi:hypothetical protein
MPLIMFVSSSFNTYVNLLKKKKLLFCFVLFCFVFFLLFSSYTCMRAWSRTLSGRLCRVSSSFSKNMVEEDNQSLHNEHNENNRVRTLRHHMNPTRTSAPSCIVSPLMHLILILSPLFNFTFFSWFRSIKSILAFERIWGGL